jgi:hypothetical protein
MGVFNGILDKYESENGQHAQQQSAEVSGKSLPVMAHDPGNQPPVRADRPRIVFKNGLIAAS